MRNKENDKENRKMKTLEEKIKCLEKILNSNNEKEKVELLKIYKYAFKDKK